MPWHAVVVSLFPELFPGSLAVGPVGQALRAALWSLQLVDLRSFGHGRWQQVDDAPFGGGGGMVLRPDVVAAALSEANRHLPAGGRRFVLTPCGTLFTQAQARALAALPGVLLLAGRYQGIDQRVIEEFDLEEISIGDYILSGGELAAQVILETVVRLRPGVLGNPRSRLEQSFSQDRLEAPSYTRPACWRQRQVPEVLLSGDHKRIEQWRHSEAQRRTQERYTGYGEGAIHGEGEGGLGKKPIA